MSTPQGIRAVYHRMTDHFNIYTVFYEDKPVTVIWKVAYSIISVSRNGDGLFVERSEGLLGRHHGQRIMWDSLPLECKQVAVRELERR